MARVTDAVFSLVLLLLLLVKQSLLFYVQQGQNYFFILYCMAWVTDAVFSLVLLLLLLVKQSLFMFSRVRIISLCCTAWLGSQMPCLVWFCCCCCWLSKVYLRPARSELFLYAVLHGLGHRCVFSLALMLLLLVKQSLSPFMKIWKIKIIP